MQKLNTRKSSVQALAELVENIRATIAEWVKEGNTKAAAEMQELLTLTTQEYHRAIAAHKTRP